MAGIAPKFLSGAQLQIKIGGKVLAYATNLQFQQGMANTGIQVIGAMANQGLEPLSYSAGGSFSILSYASAPLSPTPVANGAEIARRPAADGVPAPTETQTSAAAILNGSHYHFTPRKMLLSQTFDIVVEPKAGQALPTDVYEIYDVRMVDWSIAFSPGQLASERISFIARGVRLKRLDAQQSDEDNKGKDSALAASPTPA